MNAALQTWASHFVFAFLLFRVQHVEAKCNVSVREESEALLNIFSTIRGQEWRVKTGWRNTTLPCSSPGNLTLPSHCCWYGVTCCQSSTCNSRRQDPATCNCDVGFVTRINLPRNHLVGLYSESLFRPFACHLMHLRLNENNISGDLTSDMSGYEQLQTFMMSGNEMRGSIPTGIQNVTTLQVLDLSQNYLRGPVPQHLCSPDGTSQLTDLLLAGNALNGELTLRDCRRLTVLVAANNMFTGKVPSLMDHPHLRLMTLDNNSFTGQEIADFALASPILGIHLSRNSLPKTLENYDNRGDQFPLLRELDLEESELETTLPVDIFAVMTNLITFNAASNRLHGTLPEMRIGGMERLKLSNNNIYGVIPESFVLLARDDVLVSLENTLLSCCGQDPDLEAALRVSSEERRQIRPGDLYQSVNYSAPRLPSFLQLSSFKLPVEPRRNVEEESVKIGLECPALQMKSDNSMAPNILSWRLDPDYYMYESCECASGYKLINLTKPGRTFTFGCEIIPNDEPFEQKYEWAIAVIVVVGFIILSTALVMALLGRSNVEFQMMRWRKRMMGGPGPGQQGSLVTTDVSGYTAMCAIDPKAATLTMEIHNKLISQARWANCGSIVDQAGDSFTLAFRDAFDAVAFAIQIQLLMDSTEWPQLVKHKRMSLQAWARKSRASFDRSSPSGRQRLGRVSMRTIPEDASRELPSVPLPSPPKSSPELTLSHLNAPLNNSAKGPPSQHSSFSQRGRASDPGTSLRSSAPRLHSGGPDQLQIRVGVVTGMLPLEVPVQASPLASLSKEVSDAAAGGQTLLDGSTFELVKDKLDELGLVTEQGLWLYDPWHRRVMKRAKSMTLGINTHSKETVETAHSIHSSVIVLNMGDYYREPPPLEKRTTGARRELKTVPTFGTSNARDATVVGVEGGDVGKEHPTSLLLFQIIPARKLPQAVAWGGNLNLSPDWKPALTSQAFFSAPGALQALQGSPDDMPIVTAVFAAVSSFHALEESHPAEAANISDGVTHLVLRMLRQVDGGYLCRSFGGCKFMLTFARPEAAIRWCLGLQRAILHHPWPAMEFTPRGFEEVNMLGHEVFRGPRMKMGLNEGKLDSIQADYLGRADYNGDVINQASRFMEGAAMGGMVSCDEQLARRVFHNWNKRAAQLDLLPVSLVHDSYCVSTPTNPELELHGSMSTGGTSTMSTGLVRGDSDAIVSPKQLHKQRSSLHHQNSLQLLQQEQQQAQQRVVPVGAGESQELPFQERAAKEQVTASISGQPPQGGQPRPPLPEHTTVHAFSLGTYMFKGAKSPRSMVGILPDDLGPRLAAFLPLEPPPEGSKAERVAEPARHGTWIFSAYGVVLPELPQSRDMEGTSYESETRSNSVPAAASDNDNNSSSNKNSNKVSNRSREVAAMRPGPSSPHHQSWDNSTDVSTQQPSAARVPSTLRRVAHEHACGPVASEPQVSVTLTRTSQSSGPQAHAPLSTEVHASAVQSSPSSAHHQSWDNSIDINAQQPSAAHEPPTLAPLHACGSFAREPHASVTITRAPYSNGPHAHEPSAHTPHSNGTQAHEPSGREMHTSAVQTM